MMFTGPSDCIVCCFILFKVRYRLQRKGEPALKIPSYHLCFGQCRHFIHLVLYTWLQEKNIMRWCYCYFDYHKVMMPWKLVNWDSWKQWDRLLIQWSFINHDTEIQCLELLPPTWTLILIWRCANVMWLEAFWPSCTEVWVFFFFFGITLGICFEKKPKIPQG